MDAYLTNSLVLDGYRLIRFLGRGGFGEVWLCQSESMGDYRALKFIPTGNSDLLGKEYAALLHYRKAAARLRSPHLVPIEHVNRNDAGLYYVMPLADGITPGDPSAPEWVPASLATLIQEQAGEDAWFSSRQIIGLMLPVIEALQTLSDAGLVHRDVKPENILLFNGQPCLGDISLLGADASVVTRRGTPGYATPSWYVGGHPDMYGVAATLFTLLTGNLPDRMGRTAFLWPPQGEASLPIGERAEWKRLHGVIRRATDEEVTERYVDFRAMATALSGKPPLRQKSSQSRRILYPIIAGCLLIVAWVGSSRSGSRDPSASIADQQPATHPTKGKFKMVDAGGRFQSIRDRIIDYLGVIISSTSSGEAEPKRYDVDAYARSSAIISSFKARDYSACLEALDNKHAADGITNPEPEAVLFRSLLLNKLGRDGDANQALAKLDPRATRSAPGDAGFIPRLGARLVLWEALGGYEDGAEAVSQVLSTVEENPGAWETGTLEQLYQMRARMLALSGDHAAVLADERSAIALPLSVTTAGTMIESLNRTEAQARQSHLNTMVMRWELLEQEFPEYADYLESIGSPEPQPDRRDLRDVD